MWITGLALKKNACIKFYRWVIGVLASKMDFCAKNCRGYLWVDCFFFFKEVKYRNTSTVKAGVFISMELDAFISGISLLTFNQQELMGSDQHT